MSFTEILNAIDNGVGATVAVFAIAVVVYAQCMFFWRFVSCLWRGDPNWRRHGALLLLGNAEPASIAIGLALSQWADAEAEAADARADGIDAAIRAGADPFDLDQIEKALRC